MLLRDTVTCAAKKNYVKLHHTKATPLFDINGQLILTNKNQNYDSTPKMGVGTTH